MLQFIAGLIVGIVIALFALIWIANKVSENIEDMHYGREPRHGGFIKEVTDHHVSNWKE